MYFGGFLHMSIDDTDIRNRMDTAKWILDLSYRLISHYDSKTNQLITLIGFDFTIISAMLAILFNDISSASITLRLLTLLMAASVYILICISLWKLKGALVPHVRHIGGNKVKPGLIYFMDIKRCLYENEYVKILLGRNCPTFSEYYDFFDDPKAFEKCIIEDCARDIFAHAKILEVKTKFVKEAFDFIFATTIVAVISVSFFAALKIFGL